MVSNISIGENMNNTVNTHFAGPPNHNRTLANHHSTLGGSECNLLDEASNGQDPANAGSPAVTTENNVENLANTDPSAPSNLPTDS